MKEKGLVFTAVFTAVLSTSCCLPAFLFLFFGVSIGSLSFLQELDTLRTPLALFSVAFLVLYFIRRKQIQSCSCTTIGNSKKQNFIKGVSLSLIIAILLFYPEFSIYFIN
jgi:mercuric ion transport protein